MLNLEMCGYRIHEGAIGEGLCIAETKRSGTTILGRGWMDPSDVASCGTDGPLWPGCQSNGGSAVEPGTRLG